MKFAIETPTPEEAPVKLEIVITDNSTAVVKATKNGITAELLRFTEDGNVYRICEGRKAKVLGFKVDDTQMFIVVS